MSSIFLALTQNEVTWFLLAASLALSIGLLVWAVLRLRKKGKETDL